MSEYSFTSLFLQYRDRRKTEAGTMPYTYQMTSRFLYSARNIDSTAHSRHFNSLKHCICTTPITNIRMPERRPTRDRQLSKQAALPTAVVRLMVDWLAD